MRGTIKFYSREKGYGFIYTDEHDKDIYFRIEQWKNHSAPNTDDIVEFETKPGRKGPQAINIKCVKSAQERKQAERQAHIDKHRPRDDRITCHGCGKKIVPRMVTYKGEPDKSLCPYCGTTIRKFGIPWWVYAVVIVIALIIFNS